MSFLTHPAPKHMLDLPAADTDTRSRAVEPRRAKSRVSVVVGRRLAAGAGALTAAAVIGSAASHERLRNAPGPQRDPVGLHRLAPSGLWGARVLRPSRVLRPPPIPALAVLIG